MAYQNSNLNSVLVFHPKPCFIVLDPVSAATTASGANSENLIDKSKGNGVRTNLLSIYAFRKPFLYVTLTEI